MPKMMNFSTAHLTQVFADEGKYEAVKNLMFDLASNKDIYDNGVQISKQEANDKVRKVSFEILGLDPNKKPTKRDRNRAVKKHGEEWFEVIEDVVDLQIETGFSENPFFQQFVETRNIAEDDKIEFHTDDQTVLSVAKVSGAAHDFLLQRLGEGDVFTVPTSTYGGAVGADIDRYLVGQEDWAMLTQKIADAFVTAVQNEVYAQVMNAKNSLPVKTGFQGNGSLSAESKEKFDAVIDNVAAANGSDVVIMGTKTALRQLNKLAEPGTNGVNWIANSQKEAVAHSGILGDYEGNVMVEIPQRFADRGLSKKLIDDKAILIMPNVTDNKFVKMVDQGETEINEVTDKGEASGRYDDVMKYEMTRDFGVAVVVGRQFGAWELA